MIEHLSLTLNDIENMIPYEREVYLTLLNEHIKEQNRRMREAKQQRG